MADDPKITRGDLLNAGYTLKDVSRKLGAPYQTVHAAFNGKRKGRKSRKILQQISKLTGATNNGK